MHIYFSGIGGVGIGPLAMLAQDVGYSVEGSDKNESAITRELVTRGIPVVISNDATALETAHNSSPIDLFVHSTAISSTHPEMQFATAHGIPTAKRHELINRILQEKQLKLIAISGTHGKTTSTGMAVWVFKQLGIPVSYSVGSQISFGPTAAYEPGSEYFVYEADEFDKNMLQFTPHVSLITSVDYDHPDTYPTEEDYIAAFATFITQSSASFVWSEDAGKFKLDNTTRILEEENAENASLTLHGTHNRENAFMVASALSSQLGHNTDEICEILNAFPGTARRFEKLAENIYTDYAHHPVEIEKTLQLARELNNNVVVVYQPHQNIRQHELMENGSYKNAFTQAQAVYWLPTYLSREDPDLPVLEPQDFIETLANKDSVHAAEINDELAEIISEHASNGSLVIAMSAGDLDAWMRQHFSA